MAFGVFFKTRNKDMKGVALSSGVTGLFGITEPAIYGVNLRLKKPMICGCIAGAVGGAIAGGMGAVSWSYNMPGIATLPAYFKEGYMNQFLGLLISIAVSFILAAVLTVIVGFEDEPAMQDTEIYPVVTDEIRAGEWQNIPSPAKGMLIPVKDVKDEMFASAAMGNGVGILSEDGKIYAPFDAVAEAVFPTGHAVGLISHSGLEVLIHIGVDTVQMDGKGFRVHVSQGDTVKQGDLLVEYDKDLIEQQGYDPTVIYIITNMDMIRRIELTEESQVDVLETAMRIQYKEVSHEA